MTNIKGLITHTKFCTERKETGCWNDEDRKRKGIQYQGTQFMTQNGYTCQKWSAQSPVDHNFFTIYDADE